MNGTPAVQDLSILMVEDNAADIELIKSRLDQAEMIYRLEVVDSEGDLRERLLGQRFDAILSDFAMSAFSGPDALAIARQLAPETPFIFVSGMIGEELAVDMLRCGATDYVLKQRLQRLPMIIGRAVTEARERKQRLRAEAALREYEAGFRLLIDTLKDYAVIGLDRDARIRSWNSAAENMLGYDAASIIGQPGSLLYQGSESSQRRFMAAVEGARVEQSHVADHWLHSLDGRAFFASIVTTAIRDESGELIGFSKIIRDTTETRRNAEALRIAKEESEAANSAKDHFLAALSHELRAPLTSILTAVEVVERSEAGPENLRQYLPVIRRNVELEARLIDDLLDFTTVSSDALDLDLKSVDLHDCLHNVLSLSRPEVANKSLDLQIRLTAGKTRIHADASRVQQVVWNLILNAIKFTPDGGYVRVESSNPDVDSIMLCISDSGKGIAAEMMPQIFSGFEREDAANHRAGGLGIGLAVARKLVEKHGGSLEAESGGAGQGAKFSLSLPLENASTREDRESAVVDALSGVPKPLRILLVEDNEDTLMAMQALLEIQGNQVVVASTVAAAKGCLASTSFDLLIGDIGLPDGDGTEVVAAFNRVQKAPSIAVTGYGTTEDRQKCRRAGFTAHLTKPVNFDRLTEMIQTVCTETRPHL